MLGRVIMIYHLVALQAVKVEQLDRHHLVAGFGACGPHRSSCTATHFMLQLVPRCIRGVPEVCVRTPVRQDRTAEHALPCAAVICSHHLDASAENAGHTTSSSTTVRAKSLSCMVGHVCGTLFDDISADFRTMPGAVISKCSHRVRHTASPKAYRATACF